MTTMTNLRALRGMTTSQIGLQDGQMEFLHLGLQNHLSTAPLEVCE